MEHPRIMSFVKKFSLSLILWWCISLNAQENTIPFLVLETQENLVIDTFKYSHDVFKNPSTFDVVVPSRIYWVRLDFEEHLKVLQEQDIWHLGFLNFDFGTLFYSEDSSIKPYIFGTFDSKNENSIQTDGLFFPFSRENLIDGRFLYLKVKCIDGARRPAHWNFVFVGQKEKELTLSYYSQKEVKALVPIYIFMGICLMIFVITLTSWLVLKKMEFLFHALYVMSLSLFTAGVTINLGTVLFVQSPLFGHWLFEVLQIAINACYLLFIVYYLDTKRNYTKIHHFLVYALFFLGIVVIADGILFFKGYYLAHGKLLVLQRFIMLIFAIVTGAYLFYISKNRFVNYVVLGMFLFVLGALGSWTFKGFMFIITGAFLEIVVFGLGLIYKVQEGYKERLNFEIESNNNYKKALRAQINPHFIFNALSAIQNFIISNHKSAALKYLSKFSRLTRNILESSIETNVVLDEEIQMLKDYLELESLRFDGEFEYEIVIGDGVDVNTAEIPFMILQPFVENAIIHGLLPKKEGSRRLRIGFTTEEGLVICEIDDNGVGRKPGIKSLGFKGAKKKSRGLEVTKQRLESLSLTSEPIQIIDKIDDEKQSLGTKVIVKIPAV